MARPHSSRASASAPVSTSSSPWSSGGISASDWAVKRSHSSRKSIAGGVLGLVGAGEPPKPSAAASVEMKPPFSSGSARRARPPSCSRTRVCASSRMRRVERPLNSSKNCGPK